MKAIFDFILESLINSTELNKDLNIEKSTYDNVAKILDTDDYNHFKVLGLDNMSEGFLFKEADHFEIKYKNNTLGVIGICFPKNIEDNIDNDIVKQYIWGIIQPILRNHREKKFEEEIFIDNNLINYKVLKDYSKLKIAYICEWAINQNIKKKIDINNFALIKVFFDKLYQLLKENNCEYIIAHAKDKRTSQLYVKVGKCISLSKSVYNFCNGNQEAKESLSSGIVGKKI